MDYLKGNIYSYEATLITFIECLLCARYWAMCFICTILAHSCNNPGIKSTYFIGKNTEVQGSREFSHGYLVICKNIEVTHFYYGTTIIYLGTWLFLFSLSFSPESRRVLRHCSGLYLDSLKWNQWSSTVIINLLKILVMFFMEYIMLQWSLFC